MGVIGQASGPWVPSPAQAAAAVASRVCLVDGTLLPCWSWKNHRQLWTRKQGVTANAIQVVSDLKGRILFVSGPVPGSMHVAAAVHATGTAQVLAHSGGVIADLGYLGCGFATSVRSTPHSSLSRAQLRANTALARLRAPIERAIADLKTWRVLSTDYRRPLASLPATLTAVLGLYFLTRTESIASTLPRGEVFAG